MPDVTVTVEASGVIVNAPCGASPDASPRFTPPSLNVASRSPESPPASPVNVPLVPLPELPHATAATLANTKRKRAENVQIFTLQLVSDFAFVCNVCVGRTADQTHPQWRPSARKRFK